MIKISPIHILAALCLWLVWQPAAHAQTTRNTDVGIGLGAAYYMGDVNPSYHFLSSNVALVGSVRRNFNDRYSVSTELTISELSASDLVFDNTFKQMRAYSFNSPMAEFAVKGEFNFFSYTGFSRKPQFTPYVSIGLGGAFILSPNKAVVAPAIPFGLGLKFNFGPRFNLDLSWTPRRVFTDDIEGLGNNYFESSSPYFRKQKFFASDDDWYYTAMLKLSFKIYGKRGVCQALKFYMPNR